MTRYFIICNLSLNNIRQADYIMECVMDRTCSMRACVRDKYIYDLDGKPGIVKGKVLPVF